MTALTTNGSSNVAHASTPALIKNLTGIEASAALFDNLHNDLHGLRSVQTWEDVALLCPSADDRDFDKIMMLGEFMRRVASPAPLRMPATAKNIADAIRPYASLMQEELWIVTCDSARPTPAVLNFHHIYVGGRDTITLSPPDVFRPAIVDQASAMILVHTHPNDQASQTLQDIATTKHYRTLANMLEITLLDHIIVSRQGFFSMVDDGALAPP